MGQSWFGSSVVPFRLVFLMWAAFYVEFFYGWRLTHFGIIPWEPIGLIGIFTAPLLHGSLNHLISNTIPLLFLGTVLFFFYDRIAGIIFLALASIIQTFFCELRPIAVYIPTRAPEK